MIQKTRTAFYHFDRIRINSETSIKTLEKNLPVKELEKECHTFKIGRSHKTATDLGSKCSYNYDGFRKEFLYPERHTC